MVGLTATPARLDGKPLTMFKDIVLGPSIPFLTERGHLAEYDIIAPGGDEPLDMMGIKKVGGDYQKKATAERVETVIVGDCVKQYEQHVAPHTCLVYCVTRDSARKVRDRYREKGVDAYYVGGDTAKGTRRKRMLAFRKGEIPVVTSVDLFGEGLDAPGLKAVQFLRPTASLGLYMQMCGRVLRPDSGRAVILDPVGNVYRHGLPCMERQWTLDEGMTLPRETVEKIMKLIRCAVCMAVFEAASTCPRCGAAVPVKKQPPRQIAGKISKVDKEAIRKAQAAKALKKRREVGMARTMKDLVGIALERGYKPGWAATKMRFRTGRSMGECYRHEMSCRKELKG